MSSNSSKTETNYHRSPLLMNRHDTALIIVDVQKKLLPHIRNHEELLWNIGRLIDGANELGIDIRITEQYPQGLGETAAVLTERITGVSFEKLMFSCRECDELLIDLNRQQTKNVLLVGIESHVCVMQSAMDVMAAGFDVYVCVDAVGSRFEIDHQTALRRMELSGATLVTAEMALFEWCEIAGSEQFKRISKIVRELFPG